MWDSATVVRSSPASSAISPSKSTHSLGHGPRSVRAHGRHVHRAGYQQLMDIINLPRRAGINQTSTILKPTNCGPEPTSVRVASSSATGRSTPKSSQCVDEDSERDDGLKPTDVLVQFVNTL